MEFSCQQKDLQRGVQLVDRIVATRSTLPIIGNILFEATKGALKLSANNLEVGIEVKIDADVTQEGTVLIPAKTFSGIVAKLPGGAINFKVSEKGPVKVSYHQSHSNLPGLPSDEFPQLPKLKEAKSFSVNAEIFRKMVEETIFATSSSEEKYVLSGILLELNGEGSNLKMVATDGYRLAKAGRKLNLGFKEKANLIIPARAMQELSRILEEKDEELKVSFNANQIAFNFNEIYLVSRLIQGQFPDYAQVIPKQTETKITINTDNFREAAERAQVIASSGANIVKLELKSGKLHIIASTPDVGSVDEVVEVEVKGQEKCAIAFNVRLLNDALKIIESSKVRLELGGPLSPGVLHPEEEADYTYIIMPIRTTETAA